MISIIVAVAENYAIGKKGDLLCHLPADLKHFKEITSGKTVMMGERTFYSLPKHPLPNRRNIVLTDVAQKLSIPWTRWKRKCKAKKRLL